jgi:hypothetical protein
VTLSRETLDNLFLLPTRDPALIGHALAAQRQAQRINVAAPRSVLLAGGETNGQQAQGQCARGPAEGVSNVPEGVQGGSRSQAGRVCCWDCHGSHDVCSLSSGPVTGTGTRDDLPSHEDRDPRIESSLKTRAPPDLALVSD